MFYREIAPSPELAHFITSFWEFTANTENPDPVIHEVFPDGCISIFYYRNKNNNFNLLFIKDLSLETVKTEIHAGDVYWGMRLAPPACAKILRHNLSEIKSRPINETEHFAHLCAGLSSELNLCQTFEEAIKVYETRIKSLGLTAAEIDEKIAETVSIIEEKRGEIKISELAAAVNLSVRQLERRFQKSAGLSPKQYVRARRIRATAINILDAAETNWANRAAEMGFTDQSHLSHEFSALTGRSPNSFAEKVRCIEHGELIK
jgi:methylphosphotriester-DNA--protein-cysteine methyltransferase